MMVLEEAFVVGVEFGKVLLARKDGKYEPLGSDDIFV